MRAVAAIIVVAVATLWATLYRSLPQYPPRLGLSLAAVATLFLIALTLMRRMHRGEWPGIAQFGFIVSAVGLGLWLVGGTLNTLGLPSGEVIARPQAGWGLFSIGLVPIGIAAVQRRWSLPIRLFLPLGALFLLGEPLKALPGERAGGMTIFVAFGVLWLVVAVLLPGSPAHAAIERGSV